MKFGWSDTSDIEETAVVASEVDLAVDHLDIAVTFEAMVAMIEENGSLIVEAEVTSPESDLLTSVMAQVQETGELPESMLLSANISIFHCKPVCISIQEIYFERFHVLLMILMFQ